MVQDTQEIKRELITPSMYVPSVFVVIPTYNEADNLPRLVAELLALSLPGIHIVVVDDHSPDGTGIVAEGLKLRYGSRFHAIRRHKKRGLGSAYLHGFRYAIDKGADFIIQMDADLSHSPRYIPQFLWLAQYYHVIVGSRYVEDGLTDPNWSRWRSGLSWWANSVYVRFILGVQVRDATAGFKCWSRQALQTVLEHPISSNGYIFQVEMAYLAEKLGFRVIEAPIIFKDRRAGRSKMTMGVKLEAAWRTWHLRWHYRQLQAPKHEAALVSKTMSFKHRDRYLRKV